MDDMKKDIKRSIKNYIYYTKKIANKDVEKSMKKIFQMTFNLSANNIKEYAESFTPLYLEVIEELNIQSQLDECILINQKRYNKNNNCNKVK